MLPGILLNVVRGGGGSFVCASSLRQPVGTKQEDGGSWPEERV